MQPSDSLPVQIKATRSGFTLVPDGDAPFATILAYLEKRLKESRDFFQRSAVALDARKRPFGTDEILQIHHLLRDHAGVSLTEIRMEEDLSFSVDRRNGSSQAESRSSRSNQSDNAPLIVKHTCRSGMRIVAPSDCLVLGDVNPGAEIVAMGDIIVFGNLRGVAHAGAGGNRSARIWALSIEPNQIRIADLVAVPPRGNKPTPKRFEIAEIQDNLIEVITI
jgi:septum site-determining protein MinC